MFVCIPLGHCIIIGAVFMCQHHWVDRVYQVDGASDVCDLVAFHVKLYISFLKDAYLLCLNFGGGGIFS